MSSPQSTSEPKSRSEELTNGFGKKDTSSTAHYESGNAQASNNSDNHSSATRVTLDMEFIEGLRQHAADFLGDGDQEMIQYDQEIKETEKKSEATKNGEDMEEDFHSDSSFTTVSSVSSSELRPKSKKRPPLMHNPQAAWAEARSMTVQEVIIPMLSTHCSNTDVMVV